MAKYDRQIANLEEAVKVMHGVSNERFWIGDYFWTDATCASQDRSVECGTPACTLGHIAASKLGKRLEITLDDLRDGEHSTISRRADWAFGPDAYDLCFAAVPPRLEWRVKDAIAALQKQADRLRSLS